MALLGLAMCFYKQSRLTLPLLPYIWVYSTGRIPGSPICPNDLPSNNRLASR